jgi:hypothetical protein
MQGNYKLGSELWTIKHCDKNRLRPAEMKYLRRTAGYTLLNLKRNEEILEELHVTPLEDKLCTCMTCSFHGDIV